MGTEFLVSLIVAVLGLIFKLTNEQITKEKESAASRIEELRKPLAEGDADSIHVALSDQHDRMQQALRDSVRPGDSNNNQAGT